MPKGVARPIRDLQLDGWAENVFAKVLVIFLPCRIKKIPLEEVRRGYHSISIEKMIS